MSTELIWVPKPDGITWNSNRTRDLVDLAFTIQRQNANSHAMITVRCSKNNDEDGRARTVIGCMFVSDHKTAKSTIQELVNHANTKATREEARKWLLETLLDASLSTQPNGINIVGAGAVIDGVWCHKTLSSPIANESLIAEEEFNVVEHVESLPLEIDLESVDLTPTQEEMDKLAKMLVEDITPEALVELIVEAPSSGIYKVDSETESWTPWSEIGDNLAKAIAAKRAAIAMKENVEAVMETASPVVEPEPVAEVVSTEAPKFITINGKQIQIGWPE